ncbi:DUF6702 family protein [Kordiimonas sp. SCSIO 12610]|uniref:DUF6702 family protein n=1 Tax=Kordiimonas sp. SCSIO 12610 TaxID=2829597 RepID=UPI00210C7A5C|nr:DUF6702 family protein [Kordiimonas sp. SCSIO 12610]UTW55919.1 hypothetical protein KFF44_03225 [Kordiimonas sp. SCSIO 12610]
MKFAKLSTCVALSILGATFAYTSSTQAHRTSSSLTSVVWIASDKNFEVTHRLHLHDVQQALRNVIADPSTTAFDPEGQAELILYMEETFSFQSPSGQLELTPLGAEVEGDYVYVYQEASVKEIPPSITIQDLTFHDIYPEQENQVNIEYQGTVTSLVFNASDDKAKSAKFSE